MATKVFTMYAKLDKKNSDVFHESLFEQNQYRNKLIALQLKRSAAYQEIRRSFNPRLAELDLRIAELCELPKRERRDLTEEEAEEKKALIAEVKPLRAAFNALMKPANEELKKRTEGLYTHKARAATEKARADMANEDWPDEWKEVSKIEAEAHNTKLSIRSQSGLAQCLYEPADNAMEAGEALARDAHQSAHRERGRRRLHDRTTRERSEPHG